MKTATIKNLASNLLLLVFSLAAYAQTNVSGGIYNNNRWTKVNSPYIVTDTIVIFPGVTLTIEPGVTVKFENQIWMEVRQGAIIAQGTGSDSITFTSNSISPIPGIYHGITLNGGTITSRFNYCNFRYAEFGLQVYADTTLIKNSNFNYNNSGLEPYSENINIDSTNFRNNKWVGLGHLSGHSFIGVANYCTFSKNYYGIGGSFEPLDMGTFINCKIDSNVRGAYVDAVKFYHCQIDSNRTGILASWLSGSLIQNSTFCSNFFGASNIDTIINCNFSQNHIGVQDHLQYMNGSLFNDNDTALYLNNDIGTMINNLIFHNHIGIYYSSYNNITLLNNKICNNSVYNLVKGDPNNTNFFNTCWCDSDSASISSKIYDGYDNITLGLVNFSPFIKCDSSILAGIPAINCPQPIITQVEEQSYDNKVSVFPNPFSSNTQITFNHELTNATLRVYTVYGQLMRFAEHINSNHITIYREQLQCGLYIYSVYEGANRVGSGKLIIQ